MLYSSTLLLVVSSVSQFYLSVAWQLRNSGNTENLVQISPTTDSARLSAIINQTLPNSGDAFTLLFTRANLVADLGVRRRYEIGWTFGVLIIAILTGIYSLMRKAPPSGVEGEAFSQSHTRRMTEPASGGSDVKCKDRDRSLTITKKITKGYTSDDCDADQEDSMAQTGYATTVFGQILLFLWMFVAAGGYLQLIVFTCDYYLFALHVPDLTWLQLAEPFLVVFVIAHAVLFLHCVVGEKARVFFMTPCSLPDATFVLIEERKKGSTTSTLTPVESIIEKGQEVPDEKSRMEASFFEYTCVRYLWDSDSYEERFRPSGCEDIKGKAAWERLKAGGLTHAQIHEREAAGPNTIRVQVPGAFRCVMNEFLSPIYIFQFSCIWVYMFYSTWNIASIWLVLAMVSGSTKAYLLRRNQLHIKALAETETTATLLRNGEWQQVGSADVKAGDIVRIEDGAMPCDVVVLAGCAVVNESMLTGEPMPVQRAAIGNESAEEELNTQAGMKRHCIFAGTNVMQSACGRDAGMIPKSTSGEIASSPRSETKAVGIAIAIGARTAKGDLVRMVLFPSPSAFKFTEQLPTVYMIMVIYVCVLFILCLMKDQGHWIVAVFTGLCLLTQSLQPNMPVSFTLAQNVASHHMKLDCGIMCLAPDRLPVAGKVQVMVLDKTGTITKDGMDFAGVHPLGQNGLAKVGDGIPCVCVPEAEASGEKWTKTLPQALQWAVAACHTVTELEDGSYVGNAVEVAMLTNSGWKFGPAHAGETCDTMVEHDGDGKIEVLRRLDFDHHRMTSGVVIRVPSANKTLVLIKGSYEKVETLQPKNAATAGIRQVAERYAQEQYYVLGLGIRELAEYTETMTRDDFEKDLSFDGLLLFRNELKPDSGKAMEELREGGVRCVMCTGDNALTGAAVALRCGMMEEKPGCRIILGDAKEEQFDHVDWTIYPTGEQISHGEVIAMDAFQGELVLTRQAFLNLDSAETMELLWDKVRVYARMKPEDKVHVIEMHQAHGLVVGMAGDGGNDCGALRAAHVGLALSEAEASIVAPFSSGAEYGTGSKSLRAMPHLLRYGRATLANNMSTFLYFMVYALCLPFAKFVLLFMGNMMMSEWAWLFIDIIVGSGMVATMTLCRPADLLSSIRPSAVLLGPRTFLTLASVFVVYVVCMTVGMVLLHRQDFYIAYDSIKLGIPGHEWQKKGDNYDTAAVFLFMGLQLPTAAFVLCWGAEHRKSIVDNWKLVVCYVLILVFFFVLVWGGPSELHCVFRVNCDSHTSQHMYVPFIQELSSGNIGGCFLGPQLADYKIAHGEDFQIPDAVANDCRPHHSVNMTAEIQDPSGGMPWLGGASVCQGPNNCFTSEFRTIMSVLMSVMVVVTCGLSKFLGTQHPAKRQHFPKL